MINLYNNHQNKNLKFKMDITGVETSEISPRLIIESGDNIHMVKGKIEGNEIKFDLPILETLSQGDVGKVFCEVIISDEQYSKLWEEKFEIVSKVEVKVLESNFAEEENKKIKPIVNLTSVVQMEDKPEIEDKVEESVDTDDDTDDDTNEPEKSEKNSTEVEKNSENDENDGKEKIYTETKNNDEDDEVFSFDKFVENKKI